MQDTVNRLLCLRVSDVMSKTPISVPKHATMADAAATLLKHSISGLVVVNDWNRCTGMVSAFDFVKQQSAAASDAARDPLRSAELVEHYMTPSVESVAASSPLIAAARKMCQCHVHRLPVLDDQDQPLGMITALDIVAAIVNAVDEERATNPSALFPHAGSS